jgi:hypothetical protein
MATTTIHGNNIGKPFQCVGSSGNGLDADDGKGNDKSDTGNDTSDACSLASPVSICSTPCVCVCVRVRARARAYLLTLVARFLQQGDNGAVELLLSHRLLGAELGFGVGVVRERVEARLDRLGLFSTTRL